MWDPNVPCAAEPAVCAVSSGVTGYHNDAPQEVRLEREEVEMGIVWTIVVIALVAAVVLWLLRRA